MQPFREYRRGKDDKKVAILKWRGRVVTNGVRRKVVLFTDKKSSERELLRLQIEADAETQDGAAVRRRNHSKRPISDHVTDYGKHIGRISKNADHPRISLWMLNRLVELAGWKRLADITLESIEGALKAVGEAGGHGFISELLREAGKGLHGLAGSRTARRQSLAETLPPFRSAG
jgi:hypothetical protein